MPIREYLCRAGHKTEKLVFGEPPVTKPCPECEEQAKENPIFTCCVQTATLVDFSKPTSLSDDFRKAEARAKYKEGAGSVR